MIRTLFSMELGGSVSTGVTAELDTVVDVGGRKRLIVCDENTRRYVPPDSAALVSLAPGEGGKAWPAVERIISAALDAGLGRDGVVVAVGGGVVCDVAAFAASVYMRGCSLILIPTTLLAMVDAALGGKTGIDFRALKNLIGSFYPAEEVRICPSVLRTLPEREYRSGLAEVIKHALLGEEQLFDTLIERRSDVLDRDEALLDELVPRALMVKVRVVETDFRETGVRMHLNLGHSFGHALESVTGFSKYTHGEAVAWGISTALRAGRLLGITEARYAATVERLLSDYGYTLRVPGIDPSSLCGAMLHDKKNRGGAVTLILQKDFGKTLVHSLSPGELKELIEAVICPEDR